MNRFGPARAGDEKWKCPPMSSKKMIGKTVSLVHHAQIFGKKDHRHPRVAGYKNISAGQAKKSSAISPIFLDTKGVLG